MKATTTGRWILCGLAAVTLATAAFACIPATARALAGDGLQMTSTRLFESPQDFDGKVVELTGEAIGERMARGEFAWVHLNDDGYSVQDSRQNGKLSGFNSGIALWVPMTLSERIGSFGDHRHHGTVLRAVGEFHAACAAHGGDTDVHVTSVFVVQEGAPVSDPVRPAKLVLAIVLGAMAVAAAALERLVRRQRY